MASKKQEIRGYNIPRNYDTERKLFDLIDIRGGIEGMILILPTYKFLIPLLPLSTTNKMAAYIISGVLCIMVGVLGINGEHISEFVLAMFRHAQRKRVLHYNHNIKENMMPSYLEEKESRMLPRDRILQLIGKSSREDADIVKSLEEQYQYDPKSVVFDDDEYKPDAFKSKAELRKEKKELKRKERERYYTELEYEKELKERRQKLEREKKKARKSGILPEEQKGPLLSEREDKLIEDRVRKVESELEPEEEKPELIPIVEPVDEMQENLPTLIPVEEEDELVSLLPIEEGDF